jgi:hypothetical protein
VRDVRGGTNDGRGRFLVKDYSQGSAGQSLDDACFDIFWAMVPSMQYCRHYNEQGLGKKDIDRTGRPRGLRLHW